MDPETTDPDKEWQEALSYSKGLKEQRGLGRTRNVQCGEGEQNRLSPFSFSSPLFFYMPTIFYFPTSSPTESCLIRDLLSTCYMPQTMLSYKNSRLCTTQPPCLRSLPPVEGERRASKGRYTSHGRCIRSTEAQGMNGHTQLRTVHRIFNDNETKTQVPLVKLPPPSSL